MNFIPYDYNQPATSSNYFNYNQQYSVPSLEVIKSSNDYDYTKQWIEYFRSVGEYEKALKLEQKIMAQQGPSKVTITTGTTYYNVETFNEAHSTVENMLKKITSKKSDNIIINPNEPATNDICFTYDLMSKSAQGKGGNKWPSRTSRGKKGENTNSNRKKPYQEYINGGSSIGGVGQKLLQKMGWEPGKGLGKTESGSVSPLTVEMKLDRKGLTSIEDTKISKKEKELYINGKHPCCYINEICDRRKWKYPEYVCTELGPPHSKRPRLMEQNSVRLFHRLIKRPVKLRLQS